MSNYLAIATVTAALRQLLQSALDLEVPGAGVSANRPDSLTPSTAGVNVYLYSVSPNVAWRNEDLPTRSSSGGAIQRPRVALDLHYLLTCTGEESTLEPQRLLGLAMRTLHAKPILTPTMIDDGIDGYADLAGADLADEVERVKFTPVPLPLEELSRLWSVLTQARYCLSVAYRASVVLIESAISTSRALPVRERTVTASTFRQPVIDTAYASEGKLEPIVAGTVLVIRGAYLRHAETTVLVGEAELTPDSVSDAEVRVTLTGSALRAGVQGVQVLHGNGAASGAAPVVLRPTVTPGTATSAEVPVTLSPAVGERQRVVLFLNEWNVSSPRTWSFAAPARTGDTTSITFTISGVASGEYLVRVQVDGADSPLTVDGSSSSPTYLQYILPRVTI